MPNPKDTRAQFGCCVVCGKYVTEYDYTHKCSESHYPGCHKVHIECANKAIYEMTYNIQRWEAEMTPMFDVRKQCIDWLERWGK